MLNYSWDFIFSLQTETISITHAGKGKEERERGPERTHTHTQLLCESKTKSVTQISSCQTVIGSLKILIRCGRQPTLYTNIMLQK